MTAAALRDFATGEGQAELLLEIAGEVARVEEQLTTHLRSPVELVARVGHHTLSAGGKRLRPAFVTLAARATGLPFDVARARLLGACLEMIHMATLVHDDVIDNAATRRGRETAASLFGNTGAILTGDVMLARAMAILAKDGDVQIIRCVSQAVVEMAEGEVRELELRGLLDVAEEDHLEVLRMKTAAFIQGCCEVGALLAGAPEPARLALRAYGYHVGMAFQIVDDLLDYRGQKTGKPRATDFREGCATLPLIYLAPLLSHSERDLALRKFGNGVTDEELELIGRWMAERGAFGKAEATARAHVDRALSELAHLPPGPACSLLETVARFVVEREA